ncbi:hypothetical protein ACG94V_04345 [Acinetobacter sp. ULE_I001]|jgi:hypothetical protein|uniref:hypothetical protein n=1 Tax=unclassified Acinetobacter TaxID=196816 RepID=UPI003015FD46
MKSSNYMCVLEQIYNFLLLTPDFKSKTKSEKIVAYFKALNEGDETDFKFNNSNKVSGKFGNKKNILIMSAPEISNKYKFLSWVDEQVNS